MSNISPSLPILTSREVLQTMGRRIYALRVGANLSQPELAKLSGVRRQQSISKLELAGNGTPAGYQELDALDAAFRVGHFFKLSPQRMVFDLDPPSDDEKRLLSAWRIAPDDLKMKVMMLLWNPVNT